jgi:uncharacterized protein (TIGR03492 family)
VRLVLVSNGHGEDVIAATVARHLRAAGVLLEAVPLVGRGTAYAAADIAVGGPADEHPSGGYLLTGWRHAWADLRAGWIGSTLRRWRALRRAAATAAGCVVVGDWYALAAAAACSRRPLLYVPSAVSVVAWPPEAPAWKAPFGPLELRLMRRAHAVYPRDAATADWLSGRGVRHVRYLGNPMLDAIDGDADVGHPAPFLLLLPGTRGDAAFSLPIMLEASRRLRDGPPPIVAWAGGGDLPLPSGWTATRTGAARGVTDRYRHDDGTEVEVARGAFATLVRGARVALSTSGTAAEQCAGLGVPLVAFATPGPQYGPTFAAAQRRALGDALTLTAADASAVAEAARGALHDPELRERARRAGERAMGRPGAAAAVAADMLATSFAFGPPPSPHPRGDP